jgi:23S rRNA (uridine2552-2'-O)-methyltransferase
MRTRIDRVLDVLAALRSARPTACGWALRRHSSSSARWLERQQTDPLLARRLADGYRSRAAYKLIEIDDRFKLLAAVAPPVILDLGAAPGSWCQVAQRR